MSRHEDSIDYGVLESLKELVDDDDPEFVVELLQEYLENTETDIKTLQIAAHANDAVTLAKTAHSLKGASGNVGAIRVAAMAKELESLGKNNATSEAITVIDELRQEFKIVRDEFQTEIASL